MEELFSLQDIVNEVASPLALDPRARRIVVAGEFEAGKSSVIHAMLRETPTPLDLGFAGGPLIKIVPGETVRITAYDAFDRGFEIGRINKLTQVGDLAMCEIQTPAPHLEGLEIVEIPFHRQSGIDKQGAALISEADVLIWVTIASQAWRLSEKTFIETLPPTLRERSILAVSRADKLRSDEDLTKIEKRLQREANDFFREIVFVHASTNHLSHAGEDEAAWWSTGGAALTEAAREILSEVS